MRARAELAFYGAVCVVVAGVMVAAWVAGVNHGMIWWPV
jgi:hypothetical protein